MKKATILFFFAILTITNANSQLAIKWQKTYGGSGNDQVGDDSNYYDAPDQAAIKTPDGGYLMIGFTSSADGDFTTNLGSNDFAAVKTDSLGNVIWSKTYGTAGSDMATAVTMTSDGGYAIVGFTASNLEDVMLIKIDSSGNLIWQHTYGGSSSDRAYSIGNAYDGGFYIGATSESNDGDHVSTAMGNKDFWLLKTDSLGNLQWEKSFGSPSYDWLNSMKVCSDSGVVMCGFVYAGGGDVSANIGGIDVWVVKVDTAGNLQWEKSYGGTGNDWGFSITQSSDGGFAFAALTESNDSMVTGYHGGHDYWMVKLDGQGNLIWEKDLGGSLLDECYDILETPDNGFLIAGTTNSVDGDLTTNYGLLDFNVMKVSSSGAFEWSQTYGGSNTDWGMTLIDDGNGDYVLAGSSKSSDIDMTNNAGGWDLALLKLTSAYNTITGKYYYDNNNNLTYDSGDLPVTHQLVSDSTNLLFAFTDNQGDFRMITTDTGSFVIQTANLNHYTTLPSSRNISFNGVGQTDSLNDFSAILIPGIYDLAISIIPLNRFRPGFPLEYQVTYSNVGTEPTTGIIVMVLDSNLTFVSSTIPPDSINGDTLIWNSIPAAIQESGQLIVSTMVNSTISIGESITTNAEIQPELGVSDVDLSNNNSEWVGLVTGSFDPNDKSVSIDKLFTDQFPDVPYLDYLIRFQNTGNDTAFTVVVRDTISNMLDMSSFSFVNASHNVNVDFQQLNRVLTFTFSNILLADSTVNESSSHGYVHFRVKPNSNLINGDQIDNVAGIYFDFNPAIITNTANTQVLLPTKINSISNFQFGLYPNPATNQLSISFHEKLSNEKVSIQIVNSMGDLVYVKQEINSKNKVDLNVSNLPSGIYFIRIQVGGKVSSTHFIKQ